MSRPKSRRELYSESTRAALIDTAGTMFAERGFSQTSLDDIASATQVTRGAVYHHFDSKQALLEAVLYEMEEAMVTRVVGAAAQHTTEPWQAAMAALQAFLDQCEEPVYGRLCWLEAPAALGWARWMEVEEKYAYALVGNFISALTDAGLLRPVPRATATQLIVHLLAGAGHAIAGAAEADRHRIRDESWTLLRAMVEGLRGT
jgi:AcrR family transcriptional regulator